jgi:hypothetical protein
VISVIVRNSSLDLSILYLVALDVMLPQNLLLSWLRRNFYLYCSTPVRFYLSIQVEIKSLDYAINCATRKILLTNSNDAVLYCREIFGIGSAQDIIETDVKFF